MAPNSAARGGLLDHAFEQPHRLVNTPAQHIRGASVRRQQ
jgi:hypothetical protein